MDSNPGHRFHAEKFVVKASGKAGRGQDSHTHDARIIYIYLYTHNQNVYVTASFRSTDRRIQSIRMHAGDMRYATLYILLFLNVFIHLIKLQV